MFARKSISRLFSVLFVIVFMLAVTPLQATHAAGVRYAKPAASGAGDCSSWTNACTLQSALTGAVSGEEIWVQAGTHKPTAGSDRGATFQLINGVAVYGGFAGTEAARDDRNPAAHVTILSGDIDNNDSQTPIITDLTTVSGNTTNSIHVVTGATGATLAALLCFGLPLRRRGWRSLLSLLVFAAIASAAIGCGGGSSSTPTTPTTPTTGGTTAGTYTVNVTGTGATTSANSTNPSPVTQTMQVTVTVN
jgi:hypothetical protein